METNTSIAVIGIVVGVVITTIGWYIQNLHQTKQQTFEVAQHTIETLSTARHEVIPLVHQSNSIINSMNPVDTTSKKEAEEKLVSIMGLANKSNEIYVRIMHDIRPVTRKELDEQIFQIEQFIKTNGGFTSQSDALVATFRFPTMLLETIDEELYYLKSKFKRIS